MEKEKSGIEKASEYIADCVMKQVAFTSPVHMSRPKGNANPKAEENSESLGEFAIQETLQNEKTRERQMKESREEAVEMERVQQERGKKDRNKPITLH